MPDALTPDLLRGTEGPVESGSFSLDTDAMMLAGHEPQITLLQVSCDNVADGAWMPVSPYNLPIDRRYCRFRRLWLFQGRVVIQDPANPTTWKGPYNE